MRQSGSSPRSRSSLVTVGNSGGMWWHDYPAMRLGTGSQRGSSAISLVSPVRHRRDVTHQSTRFSPEHPRVSFSHSAPRVGICPSIDSPFQLGPRAYSYASAIDGCAAAPPREPAAQKKWRAKQWPTLGLDVSWTERRSAPVSLRCPSGWQISSRRDENCEELGCCGAIRRDPGVTSVWHWPGPGNSRGCAGERPSARNLDDEPKV